MSVLKLRSIVASLYELESLGDWTFKKISRLLLDLQLNFTIISPHYIHNRDGSRIFSECTSVFERELYIRIFGCNTMNIYIYWELAGASVLPRPWDIRKCECDFHCIVQYIKQDFMIILCQVHSSFFSCLSCMRLRNTIMIIYMYTQRAEGHKWYKSLE